MSIEKLLASRPVAAAIHCARDRGASIVLVGGAVRDALLGLVPGDLDFAVHGDAVRVARACADLLGGAFYVMDAERGVARVILPAVDDALPQVLDFVRRRGDSWSADLHDRDFTVNAIACDILDGTFIDPLDGRADLTARVLRCVGPHSLRDDPVRGIRGVRLAHQFGLSIEAQTWSSIRDSAAALDRPSAERIRDALLDLLALDAAPAAVDDLQRAGLLMRIVPELGALVGVTQSPPHVLDVAAHTLAALRAEPAARAALEERLDPALRASLAAHFAPPFVEGRRRLALFRLAVLMHDVGKAHTRTVDADGRIRFFDHENVGAKLAVARAGALRLSSAVADALKRIVALHMRPNQMAREAQAFTARALHRLAERAGDCLPELALLAICDCMGKGGVPDGCERSADVAAALVTAYFMRYHVDLQPEPLLTGADLVKLGVRPGPQFGRVLDAVREAQMAGEIVDVAAARALAQRMLAGNL
jgi:tRNA nucleotidyltransferase/poly(A) polymerase